MKRLLTLISAIAIMAGCAEKGNIEDYTVSNILLPVGSLVYVLFCTTRYGWGWDNYMKEVNTGNGLKIPAWFKVYMKFILPLIIIAVLIMSIF